MAIGNPPTARGNATGTTSAAPSAFTPSANSTLIATVFARQNTTVPAQPTISDTSGLTWVEILDQQYDPAANPRARARMFRATVGGSPSSTTVTGACAAANNTFIIVDEVTGNGTDFSNVIGANNANGDPSMTLPNVPASPSLVLAHAWFGSNNPVNAVTGFTELLDAQAAATSNRLYSAYDHTSAPQTISLVSSNFTCIAIAVEVKEPSTGAYTLTAAVGAFAVAGQAAGLRAARLLGAAVGAFAVSGQAAGLRRALRLAAAAGGLVLTGSAAGLVAGRRMTAAAGALVLAGQTAALRRGYGLVAAAGSFALNGLTAGLSYARRLVGGTGQYLVAGQSAELTLGTIGSIPLDVREDCVIDAPAKLRIVDTDDIIRFADAKAKTRIISA